MASGWDKLATKSFTDDGAPAGAIVDNPAGRRFPGESVRSQAPGCANVASKDLRANTSYVTDAAWSHCDFIMDSNDPAKRNTPRDKGDDLVAFITRHDGTCSECKTEFFRGNFIRVENGQPLCLDCADLGHLEFLPRGDAAITRRATKHSPLRVVVVEWSRSRKRYERQGILVTSDAIRAAESESLADAELRARQRARAAERRDAQEPAFIAKVTDAIRAQYPGCPADESARIAAWACEKHSGRVGRTAAAKELDPEPLRLAVIAHIRHEHTPYDRLLMRHGDRRLARQEVHSRIAGILARWQGPR